MIQKFVNKRSLTFLILCFTCLCTVFFYFSYQKAKDAAISKLNDEQFIHAKQAARGIEEYFVTWTGILTSLSKLDSIVAMDPSGKRQMEFFYDAHKDQIRSFTRMDEKGNILFSVPNQEVSGSNIVGQKHVQELIATQKPVVSDVFHTIQGYDAIALHVPVFEGKRFRGSIAIIVNFQSLAQRYLEVIRIGKTGYAWVISRDGTELYCPVPGHSGKSVFANSKDLPAVLTMAQAMLKGESGTATYSFNMLGATKVAPTSKHAVYLPIRLGNTFWSIVVTSSEREILSSLASYRNKLALVVAATLFGGLVICILVLRALLIVREEAVHQQAEAELRASEEKYRYLFEQNPAPMLIYERQTMQLLAVNEAFSISYGYSTGEALTLRLTDLYPEEEKDKITKVAAGLSGHTYVGEWHHRRKDGTVFPIFVTSHDMPYGGKTARIGVVTDITDRKLMEKAIKEEATFNRLLFEYSPDGIVIIDPKTTRFINFNTAVCRQLGYTREEFAQLSIRDVEALETPEDTRRRIDGILQEGRGDFETLQRTREGELRNVQVTTQILTIKDQQVYYCIWRDITEHKRLEEQLRQSQKMESVGRLAGGVAHDFNNMLGVIIGSADLCQHQLEPDSPLQKYLDHILKAATRSSDITRQLLAFSRKEVVSPKAVNLNSLIVESEKMLCRLIGEDVKLTFKPATDLWTILIDPAQFDQILMNLSANARDAMPDGGTLDIATVNVQLDAGYCRHHSGSVLCEYVKITVSDTGTGMDRETRDHVFEPFFTTKGVGVGTGLGLATVYGIVTQNNGFINVYSEPGQGSVFNIYLPRLLEAGAVEVETEAAPCPSGTGTVLVVEDEEMLLWTTTKILEEMGYLVLQAGTPTRAIEICESAERIDLVLTDVVMPGMNGRETVDRIRSARRDIKVLFMSGYTADIVAQRGIVEDGMFYISKPLDAKQLHEKIVQALAS